MNAKKLPYHQSLDPEKLKLQVGRLQELIFDFTREISKIRKEMDSFQQDLYY